MNILGPIWLSHLAKISTETLTKNSEFSRKFWESWVNKHHRTPVFFSRRADIAVSGMIITSARQDVVDFSSRYMDYSVGILIKRQFQKDNGFGFLNPLTKNVWVSFFALIFAVGVLMYALTRISPSAENVNELSGFTDLSRFNLRNSIWFMISSIMMQGVDIQPATPSG